MDEIHMKKLHVGFIWQGFNGRYGFWKDGLYAAMKRIEDVHYVRYLEPWDDFSGMDVLLYWEAACTITGENSRNYIKVANTPIRKALLFAGGPVKKEWFKGFDHVFVEGEFNRKEFDELGIPNSIAFGVNEDIFKPQKQRKVFDGFQQATFAGWKRQPLFSEALGERGLLCGRYQENDQSPWNDSSKSVRLPEMPAEGVASLINASHCVVNTSEYWGGGQRCVLESLACGVPVVVMGDSPKNREFIEESGAGIVCEPNAESIRKAVEDVKGWSEEEKQRGVGYIMSKWTSVHYSESLLKFING